jgi:hypothetical protein
VPVAVSHSTDPTNGPQTAGVPFKFDASAKIGAFSSMIIHYFTSLNSLTSRDCATFQTNPIPSNCTESYRSPVCCFASGGNT